ncbi:competence type IV pilus ATPase ComGA [Siminovitchia fortis]|uniref:Type II/IV secretion system protein n=1 Tax=Siminovitchia fortis TaxID=254758 RepID=A0A443J447_9BACI|nr:competence type IV pilus ATPase ComGA [Siminovitchia fortis]RWR15115.1 type II/IV secretion system protein [Siminovitchia fortis]WHY82747.1 competence type IV pilus ATPase ComGA [Siminovitchia fortis]
MTIERTADLLISEAVRLNASDIHIIPRRQDYLVKLRVHGQLGHYGTLPPIAGERLISHLKFMASMDIGERRKPQSGSWQTHTRNTFVALRISTLPSTLSKESLVIRIFPQNHSFFLEKMSLFPKSMLRLISMMSHSHGMLIFTGPTGSGKTSTIYSLAEYCASELNRNIITLEDPVERQSDQFLQMQVNEKAGITYQAGLKAVLRHDPDMIFVGEIRDAETAEIAVRAAMTGHLVLTSMHTRNAEGAVYRLLEFGIKPLEIEQTLIGVTAQRLVSLLCPFCGDKCSKYCAGAHKIKRAAVFEILEGERLERIIRMTWGSTGPKDADYVYSLKRLIRKGIALGYISHEEYRRWIFQEREEAEPERSRFFSDENQ